MMKAKRSFTAIWIIVCLWSCTQRALAIEETEKQEIIREVVKELQQKQQNEKIHALENRVKELEDKLKKLGEEELEQVKEAVDQITDKNADGTYYLVFERMRTENKFIEELSRVIQMKMILPVEGEQQTVLINGTKWNVAKGGSHVWVPLGKVVVHFPKSGRHITLDPTKPETLIWKEDVWTLEPTETLRSEFQSAASTPQPLPSAREVDGGTTAEITSPAE